MSTEREEYRQWLTKGIEDHPGDWESQMVAEYGEEGALDLLALQGGHNISEIKLTRKPFTRHPELKDLVRSYREAQEAMSAAAYSAWWGRATRSRGTDE